MTFGGSAKAIGGGRTGEDGVIDTMPVKSGTQCAAAHILVALRVPLPRVTTRVRCAGSEILAKGERHAAAAALIVECRCPTLNQCYVAPVTCYGDGALNDEHELGVSESDFTLAELRRLSSSRSEPYCCR